VINLLISRIESTADIQNFHHLKAEDKELIQSLLDGKVRHDLVTLGV
jgi:hypothetical protein